MPNGNLKPGGTWVRKKTKSPQTKQRTSPYNKRKGIPVWDTKADKTFTQQGVAAYRNKYGGR